MFFFVSLFFVYVFPFVFFPKKKKRKNNNNNIPNIKNHLKQSSSQQFEDKIRGEK